MYRTSCHSTLVSLEARMEAACKEYIKQTLLLLPSVLADDPYIFMLLMWRKKNNYIYQHVYVITLGMLENLSPP